MDTQPITEIPRNIPVKPAKKPMSPEKNNKILNFVLIVEGVTIAILLAIMLLMR